MVNAALAFQSSNSSTTDLVVVAIGITISVMIAGALLTRQRSRVKPADETPNQPAPSLLSGRQRKVLAKLEPAPALPTLMDLVREEVAEAGLREISGHEGVPDHIMLKVFRRDQAVIENCTHGDYQYVLAEGVASADALESDVKLFCEKCEPLPANESGTNLKE